MDSQVEAHFRRSCWVQLLCADGVVVERPCFTSIFAAPLYSYLPYYLYALWFLRAAPSVVSTPPVVSAVGRVVPGAFGGVLSGRIS